MSDPFAELDAQVRKIENSAKAKKLLMQNMQQSIISPTPEVCFFKTIVMRLDQQERWEDETGSTDGKRLNYNPGWVCEQTPGQLEWFLDHEALHVGLAHHARICYCEDHGLANEAADLVVNQMLKDAGLKEPPNGALFPGVGQYKDIPKTVDFETAYELLLKKKQAQQQGDSSDQQEEQGKEEELSARKADDEPGEENGASNDPGEGDQDDSEGDPGDEQSGNGEDAPGPGNSPGGKPEGCPDPGRCGGIRPAGDGSPAAAAEAAAEAQQILAEAVSIAQQMGTLPASLAGTIEKLRRKKPLDWRWVLRDWLTKRAKDRLSWEKPRSWGVSRGLYLPGKAGRSLGKVIFLVDTSGSCWGAPLTAFAGELQAIVEEFPTTQLLIAHCDCVMQDVQEFDPREGKPFDLEPRGGGGTSHIPAFEWVRDNHPDADAVVALTDLYTDYPPWVPQVPVLWAVAGQCRSKPPFGDVIYLEEE